MIVELSVRNLTTGNLVIFYDDLDDEIIRIYNDGCDEREDDEDGVETIDISDSTVCMSKRPEIWCRLTKYFPTDWCHEKDKVYNSLISLIQSIAHLSTET